MIIFKALGHSFNLSIAMVDHDSGMKGTVVTVRSDEGSETIARISPNYLGRIVPILYQGETIAAVCLLNTNSPISEHKLTSKFTLFINQLGEVYSNTDLYKELLLPDDILTTTHPRDVIHRVILNEELVNHLGVFTYDPTTLRLAVNRKVTIDALAVYRPVAGASSLHTLVGEGLDVLAYTDLDLGDVIEVTYRDEGKTKIELVVVGGSNILERK